MKSVFTTKRTKDAKVLDKRSLAFVPLCVKTSVPCSSAAAPPRDIELIGKGREQSGVRRRRLFQFFFGSEFFDFFHQRVDDLRFGDLADDFTALEDQADALTAGDAKIGRARFTGAVHFAAHHRDVNVEIAVRQHSFFDGFGQADQIDVGAAARRTGDEGQAFLFEPERFEDFSADAHFFHRIGGQRNPNRVADAFGEQGAQTDGGFDRADRRRARLGDAQVKRIIDLARRACDRLRSSSSGSEALSEILISVIADIFEDMDMAQAAFDHAFGGRSVVFLQQIFFQRAGVDADANRNLALGGGLTTSSTYLRAPMLPGLRRKPSTPCSIAISASL